MIHLDTTKKNGEPDSEFRLNILRKSMLTFAQDRGVVLDTPVAADKTGLLKDGVLVSHRMRVGFMSTKPCDHTQFKVSIRELY